MSSSSSGRSKKLEEGLLLAGYTAAGLLEGWSPEQSGQLTAGTLKAAVQRELASQLDLGTWTEVCGSLTETACQALVEASQGKSRTETPGPDRKRQRTAGTRSEKGKEGVSGETLIKISALKFIKVTRVPKTKALTVDLRMYFQDHSGEMKPTQKGISLSPEQWDTLYNNIDLIDRMIAGTDLKIA